MSVKAIQNAVSNKAGAKPAPNAASVADLQQQFSDLLDKIALHVGSEEWLSQLRDPAVSVKPSPKVEVKNHDSGEEPQSPHQRPIKTPGNAASLDMSDKTHGPVDDSPEEAGDKNTDKAVNFAEEQPEQNDADASQSVESEKQLDTIASQAAAEIAAAQISQGNEQFSEKATAAITEEENVVLADSGAEEKSDPSELVPSHEVKENLSLQEKAPLDLAQEAGLQKADQVPAEQAKAAFAQSETNAQALEKDQEIGEAMAGALAQKLAAPTEKAQPSESELSAPRAIPDAVHRKADLSSQSSAVIQGLDLQIALKGSIPANIKSVEAVNLVKSIEALKPAAAQANVLNTSNASAARASERQASEEPQKAQKALTKPEVARTLEKVQQVLKEVSKSKDGKTISVRLDPPSLGALKVDVSYRDNHLHARVVAEAPQVALLLREKAQELQNYLRASGIEADSISVSVGADDASNSGGSTSGSDFQNYQSLESRGWDLNSTVSATSLGHLGAGKGDAVLVEDHWVA